MNERYVVYMRSPMGPFAVWGNGEAITGGAFIREMGTTSPDLPPLMEEARRQLVDFFAGERTSFDLPLLLQGSDFQRKVWEELRRIPCGQTRSYGQIAKAIGRPGAARAVGGACRSNPIGLIVPCHRVIGHDGALVGFGGQAKDLNLKRRLIDFESQRSATRLDEFED
jgi:methylated-DNA-[protein]-cysteine S-methyltransferase